MKEERRWGKWYLWGEGEAGRQIFRHLDHRHCLLLSWHDPSGERSLTWLFQHSSLTEVSGCILFLSASSGHRQAWHRGDACKYVQNKRLEEEIGAKQAGCEGQKREKDHVRGDEADVERKRLGGVSRQPAGLRGWKCTETQHKYQHVRFMELSKMILKSVWKTNKSEQSEKLWTQKDK